MSPLIKSQVSGFRLAKENTLRAMGLLNKMLV
ncbi:hypothetical protein PEC106568_04480 [Pectobacterium carotovorum subsp. carotovorum]|nr:hypothetical protein PEC106568_04480 [Pectobacterium carotovorum subsp. carotovorum]